MYHSEFELGHVALYVNNLQKQRQFYEQIIGLHVISEHIDYIDLGVDNTVLVRLMLTTDTTPVQSTYGLYHLAILLPTRQALGDCFKHFIDNSVELIGASDHGYSEAIYLEDAEGNGIEVYCDKPFDTWDIRENGQIIGVTEPMDASSVYALGQRMSVYKMPKETRMGHVHLSVKNSQTASQFYQKLLNMSDKFSVPSASWLASGQYHHHVAVNQWGGQKLDIRQAVTPGLAYYTVIYHDEVYYNAMIERSKRLTLTVQHIKDGVLFTDDYGIKTRVILQK